MRLYHFFSEKYALEALRNKRIKVSIINELNDPFEFLPRFSNSNREAEEKIAGALALRAGLARIN